MLLIGTRKSPKSIVLTLFFILALISTACQPIQVEPPTPIINIIKDGTVEIELGMATEIHHAVMNEVPGTTEEYEFQTPDLPAQVDAEVVYLPIVLKGEEEEVEDAEVTILDSVFQPAQITIPAGTTVVWTQNSFLPHTVTADDGSFNSGTLGNGDTFSHTFTEAGTYPYYCAIHGAPGGIGMAGVITVESP